MKKLAILAILAMAMVLLAFSASAGTIFTNDTYLNPFDSSHDGDDIVISNCTVTIDGAHGFNSVLVASGGVLTHTASASGNGALYFTATNEQVTLVSTNPVTLLNSNVAGLVSLTDATLNVFSNGVDYVQAALTNGQTQIYRTATSSIPDGAMLFATYIWTVPFSIGLKVTVTNDFTVAAGGSINGNGLGYGPANGPGRGYTSGGSYYDASGAGHGGGGGYGAYFSFQTGRCYENLYSPTNLGSGGGTSYAGPGGAGGGSIQLVVGGTANVSGTLSANGFNATNSRAGGGAGGSIWIIATNLVGNGSITANGGNGDAPRGGGGGGGRISIQCGTNTYSGSMMAYGGTGYQAGGAGTVFVQTNGHSGSLVLDNAGRPGATSTVTLDNSADVMVIGGARVQPSTTFTPINLTIGSNSWIGATWQTILNLTVAGDMTIQTGGRLTADAAGSMPGFGTGAGTTYFGNSSNPSSGGGYGGYGAQAYIYNSTPSGGTYGSQTAPTSLGSGGGGVGGSSTGGAGGGAIQLNVAGTLQVDGSISAKGDIGYGTGGGGGSGGSIYISQCSLLTGSGTITANGGNGVAGIGGGGGGGRIAIYATASSFTGNVSAYGGSGANYGGAGTVYTQLGASTQLLLDNGGNFGTNTPIQSAASATLTVRNGAFGIASTPVSFGGLLVSSNGWLTHPWGSPLSLTVYGNAVIQPGGGFMGDGRGYGGGQGPGFGGSYPSSNNPCGGGGYAGRGGNSSYPLALGGVSTGDTAANPSATYSGSGGGNLAPSLGGMGGGFFQMTVNGTLQLDGLVSANGMAGSGAGGGGGAGGGVYLTVGTLSGSGTISVNGGAGVGTVGGGGGGGRIALYFNSNNFTGTLSAGGGSGANYGGAGTIFLKTNSASFGQVIVDNAGHAGADTIWNSSTSADLIIRNNGVASVTTSSSFHNITVNSNASLLVSNTSGTITAANVVVLPGGNISADACGSAAGSGSGAGNANGSFSPYGACSGAGHGGYGALGNSNYLSSVYAPGTIYDNITNPSLAGSGGGGVPNISTGGRGGGVLIFSIAGNLQVNGTLSANGGAGSGNGGGGGSGGSVNISCAALSGSGMISANGGYGAGSLGGGGGGGMIALFFNANSFTGAINAFGGGGANYGGAGTIYLKSNSSNNGQLVIDNAGHPGGGSTISAGSSTDVTLQNGAVSFISGTVTCRNLLISSNAALIVSNSSSTASATITATSINIQPGGTLSANLSGYAASTGTGMGNSVGGQQPYYACSGAGHAGYGAVGNSNMLSSIYAAGNYYDNPLNPSAPGSGGGSYSTYSTGGRGGGVINLSLSGNLQVDGTLSANGGNGSGLGGGGGSGGSLNITCWSILGSGSIAANGGAGVANVGGGASGGMIAIAVMSNRFSGTISATGGGGANYGAAGTIGLGTNYPVAGPTILIMDNGGHRGANTPLATPINLLIRNGAAAISTSAGQFSCTSLQIGTNAILMPGLNSQGTVNLLVSGDMTIQSGGSIFADANGNLQNIGIGRGYVYSVSPYYPCGGGGHGGFGAIGYTNATAAGGITFDSLSTPSSIGSGGGGTVYSVGGTGGGFVRLQVVGALQVDGSITAHGGNGSGNGGGGGSGGGIYLTAGTLNGGGSIAANGGNGALYGGGGGGGRIAVYFNSNNFTGNFSAYGGGGTAYGGAGTIYTKTNSQPFGQLVLDNASHNGTNTTFDFINMDVAVQNQAIGVLPAGGQWTAHNVLVHTNGTLWAPVSANRSSLSFNNLTLDPGGVLMLDRAGYSAGSGPGFGYYNSGSAFRGGAGHGGYGSGNLPGYGRAYDSITTPSQAGSGGASYSSSNPPYYGGSGGGALQLIVSDTLTVNGQLTANGGNGDYNSGGGSGGTLILGGINLLTGSGAISANGGSGGTGATGGGGGGRIALYCNSNNFTGQLSATGGKGYYPGGAGTIFTRIAGTARLLVDNGGIIGTNTPLDNAYAPPAPPFDLNIAGAASVVANTPLPLLSNLTVAAGSTLTMMATQSSLYLAVQKNASISGNVTVDNIGYAMTNGPGTGTAVAQEGSGGGYGGAGGNSASGAVGGITYGSAAQPVDFGSGGGNGVPTVTGGSEGGGAVRITVGGTLNVDGNISADGDFGWQDNSGGGAGGSVWITANTLTGAGTLSAAGGDGEFWNGGGGGGGRIAIYAPTNLFSGITNLAGGLGAMNGQPGTLFLSGALLDFVAVSQSPTGAVANTVNYVDVSFSDAVDPASLAPTNFTLITPAGPVGSSNLVVVATGPMTVRVGFPMQNLLGNYTLQTGASVSNLLGQSLAAPFTGNFSILLPTISGTVTGTNGVAVAGVAVQPDGGLIGALTDTNGAYAIGVPPGWNGTVTPALGANMFIPGALSFTNVTVSLTNQNFVIVPTIAPTLASSVTGTNLSLGWYGLSGVTYQAWYSTNLVDWLPYGNPIAGTNSAMQISLPVDASPSVFFRVGGSE